MRSAVSLNNTVIIIMMLSAIEILHVYMYLCVGSKKYLSFCVRVVSFFCVICGLFSTFFFKK